MEPTTWLDDPALAPLLALVRADPDSEGLLLSGSRGAGADDHEFDYDLEWVLTDQAFDQRQVRGEPLHVRHHPLDPRFDIVFSCPRELAVLATRGSWELPAYATAVVLYDRTGQATRLLRDLMVMPEKRARADVLGWFDAYLNAFYRRQPGPLLRERRPSPQRRWAICGGVRPAPRLDRPGKPDYVHAEQVSTDTVVFDVARYDPVTQLLTENHVRLTASGVTMSPIICRLITPGEMDLMAHIAGLRLVERFASWQRTPFDTHSTAHISVYGLSSGPS